MQYIQCEETYLNQIYDQLGSRIDVRGNLSQLRQQIKVQDERQKAYDWIAANEPLLREFLQSEDAKTRKNAALLLGDVAYQPFMELLWESYEQENTLFVKSAYLTALSHMDAKPLLAQIKDRQTALSAEEPSEENRKHINEELHALRTILIRYEGITQHTFDLKGQKTELLLIANRTHRELVRRSIPAKDTELHPLGVLVTTERMDEIWQSRCFREIVFPIHTKPAFLSPKPAEAAKALMDAGMVEQLLALHRESTPFYFRIDCKSRMSLEERSTFSKKLADALETLSGGMLINSTSDYEIELRLIENKDGDFFSCLKCATLKDHRFDYRRNAISASIHPSTAALLANIAAPYLKEDAQIMDPFCGVGTMLIERNKLVPAKEMYATDIFGEAIAKGRENAELAGARINFIHRDFFDFKHDYLFDEIITNMPMRGKKSREEMDQLYGRFFDKALEITKREAVIIMYTNEIGFVKKQLRLQPQFSLLQETCIQSKTGFYLLIIEVKK